MQSRSWVVLVALSAASGCATSHGEMASAALEGVAGEAERSREPSAFDTSEVEREFVDVLRGSSESDDPRPNV